MFDARSGNTFVKTDHEIYLRSFSPSTDSRRATVRYWRQYGHLIPVNRLGGLSMPRNIVVRFSDGPDMAIAVYRGCADISR